MGCSLGKRVHHDFEPIPAKTIAILGGSSTGKSSLVRGMEIAFGTLKASIPRKEQARFIRRILLESVRQANDTVRDFELLNKEVILDTKQAALLNKLEDSDSLTGKSADVIQSLIADGTLEAIQTKIEEPIYQTDLEFFREVVNRCPRLEYDPSVSDLIRFQWPTRGIHRCIVQHKDSAIAILDFGGSEAERLKWKFAFDDPVDEVVLVFSLASILHSAETNGAHSDTGEISLMKTKFYKDLTSLESALRLCSANFPSVFVFLTKKDLIEQACSTSALEHIDIHGNVQELSTLSSVISYCQTEIQSLAKKHSVEVRKFFVINSSNFESNRDSMQELLSMTISNKSQP